MKVFLFFLNLFFISCEINLSSYKLDTIAFDLGDKIVFASTQEEFRRLLELSFRNKKESFDLKYRTKRQNINNRLEEVLEIKDKRQKSKIVEYLNNNIDFGIDFSITGPRCLPLRSKNINSNPYHPSIMSLPHMEVRSGLGLPIISSVNSIFCPKDSQQTCTYSITKSTSFSLTDSFSISFGRGSVFSKSIGKTIGIGTSNSITDSIGKTLEKSISKSYSDTNEESISKSVSDSLQRSHEKSSGISLMNTREFSDSSTLNEDFTSSNTLSSELTFSKALSREFSNVTSIGVTSSNTKGTASEISVGLSSSLSTTVGVEAGGFWGIPKVSASVTAQITGSLSSSNSISKSSTEENNWNNQLTSSESSSETNTESSGKSKTISTGIGRSNSRTKAFSSGSTNENRVSDSISTSRELGRTLSKSSSESVSDSKSLSNSYRIDESFTSSKENSISDSSNEERQVSNDKRIEINNSTSYTTTLTQEYVYHISPGDCKMFVCFPFVKAVAIPFECYSNETNSAELVHLDYMIIDRKYKNDNQMCTYGLIDCIQREQTSLFFDHNSEFRDALSEKNALEYGDILTPGSLVLNSKNTKFSIELLSDGNLVFKRFKKTIWENKMGFFSSSYKIRVRINEKGHLIEEVKGLFSKTVPEFRSNEWIQVWSSAPINHNVTIGMPSVSGSDISYKLVVEDSGQLNLYDSVGVLTWCAIKKECQHSKGYKFPEVYLVPTNMITLEDKKDKHNSIQITVDFKGNEFKSLDVECIHLNQSQGLISKNGRFKMILENTGNLIIKDNFRTMWESASGNLPFAIPPFKMILNPRGSIKILDKYDYMVWSSLVEFKNITEYPYKLKILDEGRLVVQNKFEKDVWESWPIKNMSFGVTYFTRIKYIFKKCHNYENGTLYKDVRLIKNIGNVSDASTAEDCWTACSQFIGCTGASFNVNESLCNFYNNTKAEKNSSWVSYVKKDKKLNFIISDEGIVHQNIRLYFNHKKFSLKKAENCWNGCKEYEGCQAITLSYDLCFFFNNTNQVTKKTYDFKYMKSSSAKECYSECKLDSKCKAISFNNGNCWFYDSNFHGVYTENWISYSKTNIFFNNTI